MCQPAVLRSFIILDDGPASKQASQRLCFLISSAAPGTISVTWTTASLVWHFSQIIKTCYALLPFATVLKAKVMAAVFFSE